MSKASSKSKRWTRWMEIDEAQAKDGRLKEFGIYQIRAVKSSGTPIPISRLARTDPVGILYIGRSGLQAKSPTRTIANRIREFVKQQHSGGITYAKAKSRLKRNAKFRDHHLQVRALFLPDSAIAREETRVLQGYFKGYAELPPYNSRR